MMNYLHRRYLSILPGDGSGTDARLIIDVWTSCLTNDGTQGKIHASCQISDGMLEDTITYTLFQGTSQTGTQLATAQSSGTRNEITFDGSYPDGDYFVRATTYNAQSSSTVEMKCYKPVEQPADSIGNNEILLEKLYSNPKHGAEETDGTRTKDWIYWDVRVWKFNTTTETHYLTTGTFRHAPLDPEPKNWITTNPFYGYCIPNTTTRKDFHYYHEGKVEVKLNEKSTACGFVSIRGCTDPTATNYNASATEDDGTCYFRPQVFGCTDPNATNYDPAATDDDGSCVYAPEPKTAIMGVSPLNSLRFVATENVDGCVTFQTLDNTLFCKEKFHGIRNVGYHQKVARCDHHIYQMRSNYETVTVNVREELSGNVIDTIAPTVAVQNVGVSGAFASYLKNNTNSQTRIYFNTGDIPMPIGVGDSVIITSSPGMDGTYAIIEIKQDVTAQTPYLVINKAYSPAEATVSATVQFQMQNADYNVLEAGVIWGNYPAGRYFVTIEGSDIQFDPVTFTSEPVLLKDEHPNTVLVEYRNYDNAFDIVYTTGVIHRVRVEGEVRKRIPGGENIVHREPQNHLTRLLGVAHRTVRLMTRQLPPYLHEKLNVILLHDYVAINGVEFQSFEGYEEPEYNDNTALYNGGAIIEQKEWFKEHNDHDLGSINQQALLIVNGGFLRL